MTFPFTQRASQTPKSIRATEPGGEDDIGTPPFFMVRGLFSQNSPEFLAAHSQPGEHPLTL